MQCDTFRRRLTGYLDETLDDPGRRAVREHLASCSECRRWAVAQEPTLMFATAPSPPVEAARVEACAETVMAQVRQRRLERRLVNRHRPWLAAAAAAVLVLGGAAVWRLTDGPPDPAATPSPSEFVGAAARPTVPPPRVEVDMAGEGVRVYQFAQEDDADTAVLYIVNPALES